MAADQEPAERWVQASTLTWSGWEHLDIPARFSNCQDAFDDDAVGGEPGVGSAPQRGGGRALLVGGGFGVDEAAVVVEGAVQERVAAAVPSGLERPRLLAAHDPVAATGGHAAEFLGVDVDQLARSDALVAADRFAGLAVEVVKAVQIVAAQHPVDGRRRQFERMAR